LLNVCSGSRYSSEHFFNSINENEKKCHLEKDRNDSGMPPLFARSNGLSLGEDDRLLIFSKEADACSHACNLRASAALLVVVVPSPQATPTTKQQYYYSIISLP